MFAALLEKAYAKVNEEDLLAQRVAGVLATLEDPSQGDWKELLNQVLAAAGKIDLRGGKAKNWQGGHGLATVKVVLQFVRDEIVDELGKAPQWNEYDDVALEVLASLRDLFRDACTR